MVSPKNVPNDRSLDGVLPLVDGLHNIRRLCFGLSLDGQAQVDIDLLRLEIYAPNLVGWLEAKVGEELTGVQLVLVLLFID